jgi:hypothetical protein
LVMWAVTYVARDNPTDIAVCPAAGIYSDYGINRLLRNVDSFVPNCTALNQKVLTSV